MRQVDIGGLRAGVVGLGTWQLGAREWNWDPAGGPDHAAAILRRARDLGVTLIDTAEVYGLGASERLVGHALTQLADGHDGPLTPATKVLPVWPTARMVQAAAARSLTRLRRDHLDLYQIHGPNPLVPQATTMDGMRQLQANGTVRHVGVSNYSLARWQAADAALGSPVLSNQVPFSLLHPQPAHTLVPYATRHDRLIIASSPLAQGILTGNYPPDRPPNDFRAATARFSPDNLRRAQPVVALLREIADAHQATPAQVALAWVASHPNTVAIPGAKRPDQVEANAAAAELTLTAGETTALTAAAETFRTHRTRGGNPAARLRRLRPHPR